METPKLETIIGQEVFAIYVEEIAPRIKDITGPMAMVVKGLMIGLEPQLPDFFEMLDQDQDLQDQIITRLRSALAKIDAIEIEPYPTMLGQASTDIDPEDLGDAP